MAEVKLNAKKREIVGRKVKVLRREGLVPGNVYGKKVKSFSVSLKTDDLDKVFKQVGETGIVKLLVEEEKEERPVLIQNLQVNPVTDKVLHVDLRQVVLSEKITAMIPVELSGEPPIVEQKQGILIQPVDEIEVEALPMDLPEKFIVDVSKLASVGDSVLISEIKFDKAKVELKVDETLVVAKIEPLAAEEVAPPPVEGEEVVEGEAPVEGEEVVEGDEEKKAEEGDEKTSEADKPAEGKTPAEAPQEDKTG